VNFKLSLLFILTFSISFSQDDVIIDHLRNYRLENIYALTQDLPTNTKNEVLWQVEFLKSYHAIDSLHGNKIPNELLGRLFFYINQGDFVLYEQKDKSFESLNSYRQSLEIALETKNEVMICFVLNKILELHRLIYFYDNATYDEYLKLYKEFAYDEFEKAKYNYFYLILNFKDYELEYWNKEVYIEIEKFLKNNPENHYLAARTYQATSIYFEEKKLRDSIWNYIELSQNNFEKFPYKIKSFRLDQLNSYKARIALQEGKIQIAKEALENINNNSKNLMELIVNGQKSFYSSVIDTIQKNYKAAYNKYLSYERTMDTIRSLSYDNLVTDLETKYQTEKKEKQLLIEQEENRKNRNIALSLGGGLLAVSIIGFLVYKNTKRKQRIAEQEKQLEIQEKETLLKEQEINTINAMIEGQEKERQRVASDLHDSIGATLSAAKLQFDHLNSNKNTGKNLDELFEKTSTLLEEAYQEVRSMAHLKNSGVLAKNGLLPALDKLARNASTNELNFEIAHFGLEHRLDNDKEIALFRILQELVTNIIKHAHATEATISLTQRDDMLSIIVEDNGRGFEKHKLNMNEGMGLSSLEKRIEHWEGSLEVDSSPGNGTNILIDIPL